MKSVAIIDYGSGNLRSAAKAFEHVAAQDTRILITADPQDLVNASHIVLPGVGAFDDCMDGLTRATGILAALEAEVIQKRKPFLGICVGMQMLFEKGMEHGEHKGLGWLEGTVEKISSEYRVVGHEQDSLLATHQPSLKIPHMGWNNLNIKKKHPLLAGIDAGAHAYFVHSFHAVCKNAADVLATVDYGSELTAVVAKDNIMGTQFHPEKSQETGLRLIRNFLTFVHQ